MKIRKNKQKTRTDKPQRVRQKVISAALHLKTNHSYIT